MINDNEIISVTLYKSRNTSQMNSAGFNQYLSHLPVNYQVEILKKRRWQDAQASLIGLLLLEEALAANEIGLKAKDVFLDSDKRPYVRATDTDFNISHSGELVVCAVARQRIGVDIEMIREVPANDFVFVFTAVEWELVKDDVQSFFEIWTKKEAVSKAIGKGLHIPFHEIEVNKDIAMFEHQKFHLKYLDVGDGYACSLASVAPIHQVAVIEKKYF